MFGGVSVIGFKSCDQGREKFQGASLDFVWFDEEPPQDIYEECRMRVLDRAGDIFGTMTPLKGVTFLYDEIYLNARGDPQVWYVFMEWADNPYLNKKEVAALTRALRRKAAAIAPVWQGSAPPRGWCTPNSTSRCTSFRPFRRPASGRTVSPSTRG